LNEATLNQFYVAVEWPPCIVNESYCYDKKISVLDLLGLIKIV